MSGGSGAGDVAVCAAAMPGVATQAAATHAAAIAGAAIARTRVMGGFIEPLR
jgi:hypothetical protein